MTLLAINPERQLTQSSELEESFVKNKPLPSVCRSCQFYEFQGRSRGYCHKLGVSVSGHWRSCLLALPPFAPSWEGSREVGGEQRKLSTA